MNKQDTNNPVRMKLEANAEKLLSWASMKKAALKEAKADADLQKKVEDLHKEATTFSDGLKQSAEDSFDQQKEKMSDLWDGLNQKWDELKSEITL